jgi:hypothetical protein
MSLDRRQLNARSKFLRPDPEDSYRADMEVGLGS